MYSICPAFIHKQRFQNRETQEEKEKEIEMDLRKREEHLLVASSSSSSSSSSGVVCLCRICHEEEEKTSTTMESPCACSGTLKFAHRGCVQRWCEEKGSTVCEICLQKFEPGYSVPPKKALVDVPVTIRGSLQVPRLNYVPRPDDDEDDYPACGAAAERSFSYCRSAALMLAIFLMFRHFVAVVSADAGQYAFTLLTIFAFRAIGILVPFYMIMRMIAAFQHRQWQQHQHQHQQQQLDEVDNSATEGVEEDEIQHHIIDIHMTSL